MNSSTENPLFITQGDEKVYNLTFGSPAGPIDLTGATVTFTAKKRLEDKLPAIRKIVTDHAAPEEGKTTITLSPVDTSIGRGAYYYDIQVVGPTIAKKTVMKGSLEITWQVTED